MIGKIIYGVLFCVLLPTLLVGWCLFFEAAVWPPVPFAPLAGLIAACSGLFLMAWGMLDLYTKGKGLPMNGFPPLHYVSSGAYRVVNHPIYVGACLFCVGLSVAFQSKAGFWLASPVLIFSCIALVFGFERQHIHQLFHGASHSPLLGLPLSDNKPVTVGQRLSAYVLVIIPWVFLYECLVVSGEATQSVNTRFAFEQQVPVLEQAELFYGSVYLWVLIFPLMRLKQIDLRHWMLDTWWAGALAVLLMYTLPLYCSQTPFIPETIFGRLLAFERLKDSTAGAFPSFHVIWALLMAKNCSQAFPLYRFLWWSLGWLIVVSCYLTGMHAILDISGGILVFLIAVYRKRVWVRLQYLSEQLANSWKEWHFGKFRVISHSLYAGLAGVTGIFISALFIGNVYVPLILIVSSLVGAALWGQFIEGSPVLLRPFGYYGSVLGGALGCFVCAYAFDTSVIYLVAAISFAAPLIQAVGRLRCLVQGCCHGKLTSEGVGIHYHHAKSRVNQISQLSNQPLHNTQLYSIITNIITWMVLFKLYWIKVPVSQIIGIYLIGNGIGRFVEEAYRGEVQTKLIGGLRIYQWVALASVVTGILVSVIPSPEILFMPQPLSWNYILASLAGGLFSAFLMGMDFPESNIRFSRLSG